MRRVAATVAALAGCAVLAGPAAGAKKAPQVDQLVVFKSGTAVHRKLRAKAVRVTVEGRRCAVARATALAALVRSQPGSIGLEDFGSCSLRAADSGQLYVRRIRSDREAGRGGWVYKVGRRLATAGAADTAGPFGSGRLRSGRRVLWFYCVLEGSSCQRTLALKLTPGVGGQVTARVRSYDDEGHGLPVPGATVSGGGASGLTDSGGTARLTLPPGRHALKTTRAGLIRSFSERVTVP